MGIPFSVARERRASEGSSRKYAVIHPASQTVRRTHNNRNAKGLNVSVARSSEGTFSLVQAASDENVACNVSPELYSQVSTCSAKAMGITEIPTELLSLLRLVSLDLSQNSTVVVGVIS